MGLRLEGVGKRFGPVPAVEDLSLEVPPGAFLTLLGPSGCGKSTTLRLVAGLELVDTGRIWLGEREITHLPPHQRGLGMVFQNYALFPHMSVLENVAYGLRSRGLPPAEVGLRAREALRRVGLEGFENRPPHTLSGGQQQRVALARALVLEPPVLLLDEPLSNLDAQLRRQLRVWLKSLQGELGITTLYVTHDQEEALGLSDLVAVMRGGRLEQVGPPEEVYRYPRNPFVASFMGQGSFLEVLVEPGAEGLRAQLDGLGFPVWAPEPFTGPGLLFLRPEEVVLGGGSLPGRVRTALFLGERVEVYLETPWGPLLAFGPREPRPRPGEAVAWGFRGGVVYPRGAGDVPGPA
ncbi:ABC transporter ATP-binding protein [Thermus altitudinis]|uniref:ABC transporter ATP-binding protein n=1 Tax=Thermus altitudinis TaxID=2908145 RepID=UPI00242D65B7|nr:ABC transporter ATP-binding protein [Thermus altitudinis]